MTLFHVGNADLISEKANTHEHFILDAFDIESAAKPGLFAKEDKWDDWAKSFEDCISLSPGSIGLPLSCAICNQEQPQILPWATDKENFICMAELSGKTFHTDSENVHICLLPFLAKHGEALPIVK